MKNSKIEWTHHTFNPWIGCTKVSPGCANCYAAEKDKNRFSKTLGGATKQNPISHWGKGAPRYRTSPANWNQVLKWNRDVDRQILERCKDGEAAIDDDPIQRPRVFCASLADWLDDEAPIEWLADLLKLIHNTPNLDWLLLTKRPQNWAGRVGQVCRAWACDGSYRETPEARAYHDMLCPWRAGKPPENVWIGTTVENMDQAARRIPHLLTIPASVRFLSCEPLLGPVELFLDLYKIFPGSGIQWVIAGGESGPGARPMHPAWARGLRDQCQAANVPFFFKQWGDWLPWEFDEQQFNNLALSQNGQELWNDDAPRDPLNLPKGWEYFEDLTNPTATLFQRVGKKSAGRQLDGREWNEIPGYCPSGKTSPFSPLPPVQNPQ